MSTLIAISGKGGVGKTTIAGIIISRLIANNHHPVLAIDADPNNCLNDILGVEVTKTIGGIREEAREIAGKGMSVGISKQELLEIKIAESLVEADNFDLIAMGRPEGAGCYCYANNVLKNTISEITKSYPFVVLDNEAGLENLSRRIVQEVDVLILVTDPSKRGLDTVLRLHTLANEMEIKYKKLVLIINRLRTQELPVTAQQIKEKTNADIIIGLPDNNEIAEYAENGRDVLSLSLENPVIQNINELIDQVLEEKVEDYNPY